MLRLLLRLHDTSLFCTLAPSRSCLTLPHQPDDVSPSGVSHHRRTSRPGTTGSVPATSTSTAQFSNSSATAGATAAAAAAANARLSMKRGSVQLQQGLSNTAGNRLSMMGPGARQSVMGGGREIEVRTS
jgi:hypothetical protein